MSFKTTYVTDIDVVAIKEVANLKDEDYLFLSSDNVNLTFSKMNSFTFKTYSVVAPNMGLFNLRIQSSLIASFIKEGVLGIRRGDRVQLANALDEPSFVANDFYKILEVSVQEGKDTRITSLLQRAQTLQPSMGYRIQDATILSTLNSLAKLDSKGVSFKNNVIYTDGPGFMGYARTDFQGLDMALTVDTLDAVSKIIRKKKEDKSITLWSLSDYVFIKDDALTIAYKKIRNDIEINVDQLKIEDALKVFQLDITEIVTQLKELKINKASKYKIIYNLETSYFDIIDPNRSVMRTRVFSNDSLSNIQLEFTPEIIHKVLPAIHLKQSPLVQIEVHHRNVVFKNTLGVALIVGRIV